VTQGFIEMINTSSVTGWALSEEPRAPVQVEIWIENKCLGSTIATSFRRDLLEAGVGHGHYGYEYQFRSGDLRQGMLELREAGKSGPLATSYIDFTNDELAEQDRTQTFESLLRKTPIWSMTDVAKNIVALELDQNFIELGANRYISQVYWFLLGREADEAEVSVQLQNLANRVTSPTSLFEDLLNGDEFKTRGLQPVSPFDGRFPFKTSNCIRSSAAINVARGGQVDK
jgi:hypothetical protein